MMRAEVESKANVINNIEICEDRDYGWVWEYAKFRFDQSTSDTNRAQEKASVGIPMKVIGIPG